MERERMQKDNGREQFISETEISAFRIENIYLWRYNGITQKKNLYF